MVYMLKKKPAFIVPYLVEPNGKVKRFLEVARNPKMKREYEELLKELKANPRDIGEKLREATWSKKSLDEIVEDVEAGRNR